ncbi:MAG TPA: SurA N-terminal domain-containing protein [Terracidiphilus sp.]|nr:SurA N-terminal domain-containing protein [Terracidiphilus sp.]
MHVEARRFHHRSAVPFFAGALLLAALAGCHRPPSPDVVASVNGKDIMRADVEKYYKASLGDNPQDPSPEQASIVRLNILHQLIEDEILQQRAAKLNLAASEEDITAKLTEMKAPYTQEEWDKQLKQRNISLDDLKRDLRRSLTKDKLLNKEIESKINITDADITGYYNAHKAEFNLIEPQYHLYQIVASAVPVQQAGNLQPKPATEADAKNKIQVLYNRLRSGEDFTSVAIQFSDNANNASNGGDMGFVYESALHSDPEAFAAIGKLKPGEISEPIPIYDNGGPGHKVIGYGIYKLASREPAGQRELNDPRVQQTVRQFLRESHAQLLKNAYLEMVHDQATVRNYYAEQILKNGGQ